MTFIEAHRDEWGVEPACEALQVAPQTYYAARLRPLSRRAEQDEVLKEQILRVHRDNFDVYGARKVWRQLLREGWQVGRDRIRRLMRALGLEGAVRGKRKRTTVPGDLAARPGDLVDRLFAAPARNRLWVADITYVPTWSGFAYTAFIIDVYSRRIVGWKVGTTLATDLALDALEMALWLRRSDDLGALIHHSDRGVQYLSIRYTDRLADAGAVRSVGTKGDSYDNALAESLNGLYKTEVTKRRSWRTMADLERATAVWVAWYNECRLHGAIGDVPPAEYERSHQKAQAA